MEIISLANSTQDGVALLTLTLEDWQRKRI